MKQTNLTLEGMRQGVRDSHVFVLVLSERVLGSWFCQQELLCAIAEGKSIQLVLEEEPRFHPFATSHWHDQQVSKVAARTILVKTASGGVQDMAIVACMDANDPWQVQQGDAQLTRLLCETVDRHLPNAVVFRRRDFEVDAMMRELCRRNGVVLPVQPRQPWPVGTPPKTVFVICNEKSAADIILALTDTIAQCAQDRVVLLREQMNNLPKADKVLLVLTRGVLSGESLMQLDDAIRQDAKQQQDRIVLVFSESLGWSFGCAEHQGAPSEVQACINNHEAIAYRERKDGNAQHEFMAMFNHLLNELGAGTPMTHATSHDMPAPVPLIDEVRERLDTAERRISRHEAETRAQLAAKDAEMQYMRAKVRELQAQLAAQDGS